MAGVSQAVVSRAENGQYPLKPKNAVKLAQVLGCEPGELLGL